MDDRVTQSAAAAMISGAATSGIGALTLTEWLAIGGFAVAFAGFVVNAIHKRAIYRLERDRLHFDIQKFEAAKEAAQEVIE